MQRTFYVYNFWSNRVMASGGPTSTTNREEQTNLGEMEWIVEGAIKGATEMFPARFTDGGDLTEKCVTSTGTETWGTDAEQCI